MVCRRPTSGIKNHSYDAPEYNAILRDVDEALSSAIARKDGLVNPDLIVEAHLRVSGAMDAVSCSTCGNWDHAESLLFSVKSALSVALGNGPVADGSAD